MDRFAKSWVSAAVSLAIGLALLAGLPGALDEVPLAERGQDDHGSDPGGDKLLCGGDPVQDRHLHVQDDQVGAQRGGQLHGGGAVAGLAADLVALLLEHLDEVEPDQRLVLGHDDASRGDGGCARVGHGDSSRRVRHATGRRR